MHPSSPLGSVCVAAALVIGLAGSAVAADRAELQHYRQMASTYQTSPMADELGAELASLNAWIEAAEGHLHGDRHEAADRLVDQIEAQVGLIEARLSLQRTRAAEQRAEVELTRVENEIKRTERAIERLDAHRARLEREEG